MDDSADFEAANEWTAKINKTAIVSGASKRRRRGVDGGRRGAAHARLPRSHSCPSPPPPPRSPRSTPASTRPRSSPRRWERHGDGRAGRAWGFERAARASLRAVRPTSPLPSPCSPERVCLDRQGLNATCPRVASQGKNHHNRHGCAAGAALRASRGLVAPRPRPAFGDAACARRATPHNTRDVATGGAGCAGARWGGRRGRCRPL